MILGEKLKFYRKQRKMTQLEVAEALDVSRQAISKWEVGSDVPSTKNLIQLSELFGVPLEVLVKENAEIKEWQGKVQEEQKEQIPEKPQDRKKIWGFVISLCALVVAIIACIGIYIMNAKVDRLAPEDTAAPMEEMDREEVDISSMLEPIIRQPLQP